MKLVIIESPFAAETPKQAALHIAYARAALRDSLMRGEAPFASHLLYTQPSVLDDKDPLQRFVGIEAGLAWGVMADTVAVYEDLGVSPGMRLGISAAEKRGASVFHRRLDRAVLSDVEIDHAEVERERDEALPAFQCYQDRVAERDEALRERDAARATINELVAAMRVLARFAGKVGREDLCEAAHAALAKAKEVLP